MVALGDDPSSIRGRAPSESLASETTEKHDRGITP